MRFLSALSVSAFLAVPAIASDSARSEQLDTVKKVEVQAFSQKLRAAKVQQIVAAIKKQERLQEQWKRARWILTPEVELLKWTGLEILLTSTDEIRWRVVAVYRDGKLRTVHVLDCHLFRILVNEELYSFFQKPE
jgi:hypothetical protein